MHEVNWHRPKGVGYYDPASDRSVPQDFRKVLVPARFAFNLTTVLHKSDSSPGTVLSDIAKSRAEIEGARLLVLSAALQIDKNQAKGALKEIGIAKVCDLYWEIVQVEQTQFH